MKQKFYQTKTVSGPPLNLGRLTLTPQAKVLTVRLPFGGFVWNRAAAVLVEEAGQTKRYPVVNATRKVQRTLTRMSLLVMIISLILIKRRKETQK